MYGATIRILRMQRGLTLRELSKDLDIPYTTLGNYEREDREPSIDVLEAIANYFDVSIDYLTGRTDIRTTEGYLFARDSIELEKLIGKAGPDVRKPVLEAYEEMFSIIRSGIDETNIEEFKLIKQILNFIFRMKQGFPQSKFYKDDSIHKTEADAAILFIQERNEFDRYVNDLFIEYSTPNEEKQNIRDEIEARKLHKLFKRFEEAEKQTEKRLREIRLKLGDEKYESMLKEMDERDKNDYAQFKMEKQNPDKK